MSAERRFNGTSQRKATKGAFINILLNPEEEEIGESGRGKFVNGLCKNWKGTIVTQNVCVRLWRATHLPHFCFKMELIISNYSVVI